MDEVFIRFLKSLPVDFLAYMYSTWELSGRPDPDDIITDTDIAQVGIELGLSTNNINQILAYRHSTDDERRNYEID